MAAGFSLVVLALAYYLISPRESTFFSSEKLERAAEFKNTRVEGRQDGKKAWEFFARSGWSEKDQVNTYLTHVERGKIYADGKITVKNLTAPQVRIDRRAEIIEAVGGVVMQTAEGKIYSDRASVFRSQKRLVLADKVRIVRPNGVAVTATSEYLSEPEQLKANFSKNPIDSKLEPYKLCAHINLLNRDDGVILNEDPLARLPPITLDGNTAKTKANRYYQIQIANIKGDDKNDAITVNKDRCANTAKDLYLNGNAPAKGETVELGPDERFVITVGVSWLQRDKKGDNVRQVVLSSLIPEKKTN